MISFLKDQYKSHKITISPGLQYSNAKAWEGYIQMGDLHSVFKNVSKKYKKKQVYVCSIYSCSIFFSSSVLSNDTSFLNLINWKRPK